MHRCVIVLLLFLGGIAVAAESPRWSGQVARLERWPAGESMAQISAAFAVGPELLATILTQPASSDTYRAVISGSTQTVRLLAWDAGSGFALLTGEGEKEQTWTPISLPGKPVAPVPGEALTLQAATPAKARVAGRELLHQSRLLECPWLRVHLPQGTWNYGTPLTAADGSLAGMLAGVVPGVTEAGRVLPAAAVRHFVNLWTTRRTLAKAVLGLRLSPAAGIPRVEECVAALPAERAGLHPGDVLLRIGSTGVSDAASAAEACFYLQVDEPVTLTVLRGTDTLDLSMTPVSASAQTGAATR